MKIAAYTALHYGKDYLPYVIRSVIGRVDKYIILYTEKPSYGHAHSQLQCPESRDELRAICQQEAGGKLEWIEVRNVYREGDHRNQVFHAARDSNLIAVIDADEVWEPESFNTAIEYAMRSNQFNIGVCHRGWHHFWRSFDEYCTDGFNPIRFHNLRNPKHGPPDIDCPGTIYHFGYAQRKSLMEYKWNIHGHQDELRKDWLAKTWGEYKKGETRWLHPVSEQIWQETTDFNKHSMPEFMHSHPFFNLDRIE